MPAGDASVLGGRGGLSRSSTCGLGGGGALSRSSPPPGPHQKAGCCGVPGDLGGGRILSVIRGRAASLLGGRSGTEEVWDKGLVLAIVVGLGTVRGLELVLGKV